MTGRPGRDGDRAAALRPLGRFVAIAAAVVGFVWWRARPQSERSEEPPWEPEFLARLARWQPTRPATPAGRLAAAVWVAPMTMLGLAAAATTGTPLRRTDDGWLATGIGGPVGAELRRRGFSATTLGQVILATGEPSDALLAHERMHVRQGERFGVVFGPLYVALLLVYGYRRHPLERAARLAGRAWTSSPDEPGGTRR